jgi:2-C-methyl-D-erythritol 4-phosphate cytidylyltransferase
MKLAVIIPAAGASRRYAQALEFPRSKLDEDLGGRPVLHRTVELFTNHDAVSSVTVAGPADPALFDEFRRRHADKLAILGVRVCQGGPEHRWQTVQAALAAIPPEATHIAIHDAARPCTPPELLDRLFDAAERHNAVIPAIEVHDTLKQVQEGPEKEQDDPLDRILGTAGRPGRRQLRVARTVDRAGLYAVQTPQVFEAGLLRRAYAQPDLDSTDDAQLVERLGEPIAVITGDGRNIKITTPPDLNLARAILGLRGPESRPAHKRF